MFGVRGFFSITSAPSPVITQLNFHLQATCSNQPGFMLPSTFQRKIDLTDMSQPPNGIFGIRKSFRFRDSMIGGTSTFEITGNRMSSRHCVTRMERGDFKQLKLGSRIYRMSEPGVEGEVIEVKKDKYIRVRWPGEPPSVAIYTFDHDGFLNEADLVMAALSL
jgi:hypothetical protein